MGKGRMLGSGRVIYELTVSVDGFTARTDRDISWHDSPGFELTTPDQLEFLGYVGAIVLGAKTHEMFADYWPYADPAEQEIAPRINELPKFVFSSSLTEASWGDHAAATILTGEPAAELDKVRRQVDGDIVVWGSLDLGHALAASGLIDVLRLRTIPVLLGEGIPLWPASAEARLDLKSMTSYPGGHTTAEYDVIPE